MAEIAVSYVIQRLMAWAGRESQLQNAWLIAYDLARMEAFIRVADEKEEIDPLLKEWVKQVLQVAYDAADVIDEFMLRFAGQQQGDGFRGRFIERVVGPIKNLKSRRQLALEMGTILSRVRAIFEDQQRYKDIYGISTGQSSSSRSSLTRADALLLEDAEVVGIEKPKKQLIEWVSSIDCGVKVISVVGTGGSGKSTLVAKVYTDPLVKMRFDVHVWLGLSKSNSKLEDNLRDLIRRLVHTKTPEGLES